jgi:diguanylate cyclase (GGDEF)-like protein
MDPNTVIVVLSLNLVATGMLLALIGRRMPDRAGMRGFATGSIVFGVAYLLRAAQGQPVGDSLALNVVADSAMIFATLAFATGMRRFGGERPLGKRAIWALVMAFAAASLVATLRWGVVGRQVVLNLGLAGMYLALTVLTMRTVRRARPARRAPLSALVVCIGLLGLLTAARGLAVPFTGLTPLYQGLAAQLYYGYSMLATVVIGPTLLWMVFVQLNDRLARLAIHDPLTGLLNRHGLDDRLRQHFRSRQAQPLVLMQIDIDHFKRINDEHGHAVGDAVLRGVAQHLAHAVRAADFVARMGGEEFLVVCIGAAIAQAQELAERLRLGVAAYATPAAQGSVVCCTVSVGISPMVAGFEQWEAALREADRALYIAKESGRNRVARVVETVEV